MGLRHALLGILSLREMSGYDVKNQFDRAIHFVWNATSSQIYRELRRMEEDGLITGTLLVQDTKPNKYIYNITEPGRVELDQWLGSPVSPRFKKDEFLLRLFFMGRADKTVARRILQARKEQIEDLLRGYEERARDFPSSLRENRTELLWWQGHLLDLMWDTLQVEYDWVRKLLKEC